MPLVDIDNTQQKPVEPTGRAVPVELKTAVVQTRFEPLQSLITQIGGSIFVTNYYSQLLGANDQPMPLQLEKEAAYQQYDLIRQLEMRLQGDFSYSQNEDNKGQTVTGEAIMYPGVVPNDGDMFIADAGQGRSGLFVVNTSVKLSYYKQTCYRVQFTLVLFIDEDPRYARNLEEKTVRVKHFVADFMRQGKNPIVIDDVFAAYRDLHRVQETMISEYLRLFFSEVCQTLLIPGQSVVSYDPFLVSAVLSLLETTQSPLLRKVSAHNTDAQYVFRATTIWDAILQVEPSHVHLAVHQMGLVPRSAVRTRAHFGGVYWAKIEQIMYPVDAREDADIDTQVIDLHAPEMLRHGPAPIRDFQRLIPTKDLTSVAVVEEGQEPPKVPNIHNVADDDYYVFSKAFYHQDAPNMSRLEKLVWSVLNQEEIDVTLLAELVKQSKMWDKLERFYFIPVLVALCTIALRGPSSI